MLQEAVEVSSPGLPMRAGVLASVSWLILISSFVGEGLESSVAHVADIAADHKRRCEVAPESEVCKILFVCASETATFPLPYIPVMSISISLKHCGPLKGQSYRSG